MRRAGYQITTVLLGIVFVAPVSQHTQAEEPMVITLSCDGTVKDASTTPISNPIPIDRAPKPVTKMGVVVNLAERTVSFGGYVAPVNTADAASVTFGGAPIGTLAQIASKGGAEIYINGSLQTASSK